MWSRQRDRYELAQLPLTIHSGSSDSRFNQDSKRRGAGSLQSEKHTPPSHLRWETPLMTYISPSQQSHAGRASMTSQFRNNDETEATKRWYAWLDNFEWTSTTHDTHDTHKRGTSTRSAYPPRTSRSPYLFPKKSTNFSHPHALHAHKKHASLDERVLYTSHHNQNNSHIEKNVGKTTETRRSDTENKRKPKKTLVRPYG